jgi:CheY-like chemotaxis protein
MEDTKMALNAGADTVLPKPLGRAHFLKLLSASIPASDFHSEFASEVVSEYCAAKTSAPKIPSFAYVDDSSVFLMGMRMRVKSEAKLHEFKSTQDFFHCVSENPGFLNSLDFIVTDFHFDVSDKYNGLSFAEELRKRGYQRPILLASGADFEAEELAKAGIDCTLPKVISGWSDLAKWAAS